MSRVSRISLDDRKSRLSLRFSKVVQTLSADSLERIGRGARLIGSATKNARAAGLDVVGDAGRHFDFLDRAGTGHDDQFLSADLDAADIDDRVVAFKFAAHELPGRENGGNAFDAWEGCQRLLFNTIVTDDADNRPFFAGRNMRFQSQLAEPVQHVINFSFTRFWF